MDYPILGVRILIALPDSTYDYYVKYEFIGNNWKRDANIILPYYLDKKDVKIQTLHPFSTSINITNRVIENAKNIWIDNYLFKLEDLNK